MEIHGKRVLITGATGGIGRAIAQEFRQRGAQLVLSGRQKDLLQILAAELGSVEYIVADLASNEDLERLLSSAGRVDILIANAGVPGTDDITAYSRQEIDACIDINLRAPILLAQGLIPGMVARGEGHLLFVSSVAGKIASPLSSLYSATKFGLRGFADCLRLDLDGTGVNVSTIYPGMIRNAGMYANSGASVPPGAPTNTPEDVAEAVATAIIRNRPSVDVTGFVIKLGIHIAHISPAMNGFLQRMAGARVAAREFAHGHRRRKRA